MRKREQNKADFALPHWYVSIIVRSNRWTEPLVHLIYQVYVAKWLFMIFAALLVYRRVSGRPFGFIDWLCLAILALPIFLTLIAMLGSNAQMKLEMLNVRGHWKEILELLPSYRKEFVRKLGEPQADLATLSWTAKVYTRLGQFDDSDNALSRIRSNPHIDEADYLIAKGTVMGLRQEYESARMIAQELIELDPAHAMGWAVACEIDAVYLNNPDAAMIAYEQVKGSPDWKMLGRLTLYLDGAVLASQGEHEAAIATFERFREWARPNTLQHPNLWEFWAMAGCLIAFSQQASELHDEADSTLQELYATLRHQGLHGVTDVVNDFLAHCAGEVRATGTSAEQA